ARNYAHEKLIPIFHFLVYYTCCSAAMNGVAPGSTQNILIKVVRTVPHKPGGTATQMNFEPSQQVGRFFCTIKTVSVIKKVPTRSTLCQPTTTPWTPLSLW